ncbi:MAG: ubiquitin-like domain-containing protein, partial [Lysinibacillus sp.]
VLFQGTKASVTIITNEGELTVATHADTVEEVLEQENITVMEHDKLSPALDTEVVNDLTINWEQAEEVTISVDGKETTVWTTEKLVENILEEANIKVAKHDEMSLALNSEVGADNKIDIQKAFQLTLVDGKEKRQVWSTSTTVANFLEEQEITLGELDRVNYKMTDKVKAGSKVKVVRVEKVTDVVEESIAFSTEKKKDSSILKGKEKVVKAGKDGKVERTYEVVKENGKVVTKTLLEEKVLEKPKTEVVSVGTKVVTASVSRSTTSGAEPAGKEFYVESTAYTPYCAGCSGVTATGINVRANTGIKVVAVDPRVIPLGSKVWVEGYGYAIAGDTGGAIKGHKIDILVHSKSEAYKWGRKKVRIKVL